VFDSTCRHGGGSLMASVRGLGSLSGGERGGAVADRLVLLLRLSTSGVLWPRRPPLGVALAKPCGATFASGARALDCEVMGRHGGVISSAGAQDFALTNSWSTAVARGWH
jgi:hypothetical protein